MTVTAASLGDLCDVASGGTPSRSKTEYFDGGIPWVKIGDLLQGDIQATEESITSLGITNSAAKILPKGTVLISIFATIGRTAVLGIDAATNQAIAGLTPRDNGQLDSSYLRRYLDSKKNYLESIARGVAQPNINLGILKSLPIPVPSLAEQRRIAAILDQADALRVKRREALTQLECLEDSLFQEFQKSTQGVCELVPLEALAISTRGSFVNGPFGSDLLTSELQEEGVPVVYIRDIRDGDYRRVSKVCVSEQKAQTLKVCNVEPGDVLVAKVGDPPGVSAVYPAGEPSAIVTQDVIRIRPNLDIVLPEFIKAYLNSSTGKSKISEITVEATRARFSLGDFKKLQVALPELALQRKFVAEISSLRSLKDSHVASMRELNFLFSSLQHRAFQGAL